MKNVLAENCRDVAMNGLFDVVSASGTVGLYHAIVKANRLLSTVTTTLGEAQFGKAYGSYNTAIGHKPENNAAIGVRNRIMGRILQQF